MPEISPSPADSASSGSIAGSLAAPAAPGWFSERKGIPLYHAHLPEDKILSILEHIHEGCGVLKMARLVKVHPDTVIHSSRASGAPARDAHDELVAHSPPTRELPMDEKWSFVAKKEKNCDEDDPEDPFRGDCWDHVAFDPTRSTGWSSR